MLKKCPNAYKFSTMFLLYEYLVKLITGVPGSANASAHLRPRAFGGKFLGFLIRDARAAHFSSKPKHSYDSTAECRLLWYESPCDTVSWLWTGPEPC